MLVAKAGDDGPKSQLSGQDGWGLGPEVRILGGHHGEHGQLSCSVCCWEGESLPAQFASIFFREVRKSGQGRRR